MAGAVLVGGGHAAVTVRDPGPEGHATWLVLFTPVRVDWPHATTEGEERALRAHAEQLQALAEAGRAVVAGPVLSAELGVLVLDGLALPEVEATLAADAMVAAGHFRAEVRAMRVSMERSHP